MSDYILKSLKKKLTVKRAEQANLVSDPELGDKPVPFGFCNREWLNLLSKMREGDELWNYSYSAGPLCGEAGIALIRAGKIVDHLMTTIS